MNDQKEISWKVEKDHIIGITKTSFVIRLIAGFVLFIIITYPLFSSLLDFLLIFLVWICGSSFFYYLSALDRGWFGKPISVEYKMDSSGILISVPQESKMITWSQIK